MCLSACIGNRSVFMDLSVIIPARGGQRHIAGCLRSVTRCPREHMAMECLVMGGDGTDETSAVVCRYAERDNRIRLVTVREGAGGDARNTGIEAASGRYILFLDAADRLCEDAWEQIEAAVGEEYADFVAFSHITARGNGKLRAQMLPISDVISTDEGVARRLMYADSALSGCGGKLFKSRIIRDNNIFFMADAPADTDFCDHYFVTEYFEHCESYLMTKAMILYRPHKGGNIMKDHSMQECLEMLQGLYDFQSGVVGRYHDEGLVHCMQVYYFGLLSDFFRGYAGRASHSKGTLETEYAKALESRLLRNLLDELDEHRIRSKTKRYEYRLLREGNTAKMRRYFGLRARLRPS